MILTHLRHNAVAYLALAVALSTGTAYASGAVAHAPLAKVKLAKNSVKSATIKNNAIRSVDVKDGSLTAADLAPGTITLPKALSFSASNDAGDPSANPDVPSWRTRTFNSGSGQTYIHVDLNQFGLACSSGGSFLGLYVDGKPVPGTSFATPSFSPGGDVSLGATVTTTPGTHTASVGADCPIGNYAGLATQGTSWFLLTTG